MRWSWLLDLQVEELRFNFEAVAMEGVHHLRSGWNPNVFKGNVS